MKRSCFTLPLAAIVLLAATACSTKPQASPIETPPSTGNSSASAFGVSKIPPSTQSSSVLPQSATVPAITADEALQLSQELSKGYEQMLYVVQFTTENYSQYITVDGVNYHLREDFASTRDALERLLGQFFSSAFVDRNMAKFFSSDENYTYIIEQDGLLYFHEYGYGIGGTYQLWQDSLNVQALSGNGWVFTMLGTTFDYDKKEDMANEDDVCTFNVIFENGRWLIDSYERKLGDGTVHDRG